MRYCDYCGAEIPVDARFCGICGRVSGDVPKSVTGIMNPAPLSVPPPETPPPFSNLPYTPYPPSLPVEARPSNVDMTIKRAPQNDEDDLRTWYAANRQDDENAPVWPDVIVPPTVGGIGQFPASNAPVVPGTPQIGSMPSVQGSPQWGSGPGAQGMSHVGGNAPPPHELIHQAPPSAPRHTWMEEHHSSSPHHPYHPQLPQHTIPPEHRPPGRKWRWRRRHEDTQPQHHEHAQAHSQRRFRVRRAHHPGVTMASKTATGVIAKWAIVLLVALVVLASGGLIFVLASSPSLSLSSSGAVSAGGVLQLHGRGFMPGGTIVLTVDNGLPATLAEARPEQATSAAHSGAAGLADMMQMAGAQDTSNAIVVGITGTFDANVVAQRSWSAGRHVLHAKESSSSRSADVAFTMLTQPALLEVTPTTLDLGTIPQGSRVAESVLIGNTGGSSLTWNAVTDGSSWLALQGNNDTLESGGAQDALYALVDTTKLKQGAYRGGIHIHSNGGDVQVAVLLNVGPPVATRQAQLNVNPPNLDFGQLTRGQQVTNMLTIGNKGTLALQWQGSTSSASWLSVSLASGSIQPGAVPQTMQVTVDTNDRSLQTGSNNASITIHSNGGNTVISVTLTLLAGNTPTPTQSPSPTLSPSPTTLPPSPTLSPSPTTLPPSPTTLPPSPTTLPPSPTLSPSPTTLPPSPTTLPPSPSPTPTPVIQVSPGNIDPTSSNCSQNSDGTFTCAVTVSETTQGNLNWFAPTGIGGTGVTFSPPNGQLSSSQTSQQVMIASIPCTGTSYGFTFVDQNNNMATTTWNCTPTPTPTPSPSPSIGLNSGTWQDSTGGSSYVGDAVTMQLTIQGSTLSGTLTGTTGASAPVQGQDGALSSFSPGDQQYLNFVIQNYGNQTGIFLAFTNSSDFEGAYAGCKYYGVLEQSGNIEGFWYFPNSSVDTGSMHMNKIS